MTYHILNGDALIDRFVATGLSGEVIVMRECLVEGNLSGDTSSAFYEERAHYLSATYNADKESYFANVVSEFEKLNAAPNHAEFNLWFGYDLFCRANMWYLLSLLHHLPITKQVFVVYPSYLQGNDIWKDFGSATPVDLISSFNNRIHFSDTDLQLGKDLWTAFKNDDLNALGQLSIQYSGPLPYLEEVCKAHINRFPKGGAKGRPERVVEELVESATNDFPSVYVEFFKREGIHGF